MLPNPKFLGQDRAFWAHVKLVSERGGYTRRRSKIHPEGGLRRYDVATIVKTLDDVGLVTDHLLRRNTPTRYVILLESYLNFRAEQLERTIGPNLMDREQAQREFESLRKALKPRCCLPMNKQKKEKRHHAFLTCIVNMLTERTLGGVKFDDNPRVLAVVTKEKRPIRTLSRWMDGAYPSTNDPIAVWETKEYYGTTTFGSRVADGVYETMLDGEELRELLDHENRRVLHYLIVDDYFTWWEKGKSYLCRIVDMLHMGLVDEVLFGREVLTRWPEIVESWTTK